MRMLVINERNDKKNDMEETVDKIVRAAKEAVKDYDSDDQYYIYEEVICRLQEEEQMSLQVEYFRKEVLGDEQ